MSMEKTVKCPICGKPYKTMPFYAGDQSACPKCQQEARKTTKPSERNETAKEMLEKLRAYERNEPAYSWPELAANFALSQLREAIEAGYLRCKDSCNSVTCLRGCSCDCSFNEKYGGIAK